VVSGEVFSLNAAVDAFDPPLFGRSKLRHNRFAVRNGYALDDVWDNFYPQASSQWDALGHVCYDDDAFFGGATRADVLAGARCGIDAAAKAGISARGVVLDVYVDDEGAARYDPLTSYSITVDDLERARRSRGAEFQAGDIMLIRTGFISAYDLLDTASRASIALPGQLHAAGLEHSEQMAEYLWNAGVSAVVSDAPALEVWPPDLRTEAWPFGVLHRLLLGQLGIFIGELWMLDVLADRVAVDGRAECFVVSAPLNAPGGLGSTANALAIR
jgi:kynurenine formamidase